MQARGRRRLAAGREEGSTAAINATQQYQEVPASSNKKYQNQGAGLHPLTKRSWAQVPQRLQPLLLLPPAAAPRAAARRKTAARMQTERPQRGPARWGCSQTSPRGRPRQRARPAAAPAAAGAAWGWARRQTSRRAAAAPAAAARRRPGVRRCWLPTQGAPPAALQSVASARRSAASPH